MIPGGESKPCTHWSQATGACGSTVDTKLYGTGVKCPEHTPARMAGRPEPDARGKVRGLVTTVRPVHPYGPDNPAQHPATQQVTLGSTTGKLGPFRKFQAPIPDAIVRQRTTINTMAHRAGREATVCPGIAHRQTNGAVCSLCGERGTK